MECSAATPAAAYCGWNFHLKPVNGLRFDCPIQGLVLNPGVFDSVLEFGQSGTNARAMFPLLELGANSE